MGQRDDRHCAHQQPAGADRRQTDLLDARLRNQILELLVQQQERRWRCC